MQRVFQDKEDEIEKLNDVIEQANEEKKEYETHIEKLKKQMEDVTQKNEKEMETLKAKHAAQIKVLPLN